MRKEKGKVEDLKCAAQKGSRLVLLQLSGWGLEKENKETRIYALCLRSFTYRSGAGSAVKADFQAIWAA
jgi:hypothetical protein